MSEYFETEEVVKDYDSAIVRRILSCIKPYKLLSFFIVITLGASTIGELFVPVLLQRVIDEAVLARYLVIRLDALSQEGAALSAESRNTIDTIIAGKRAMRIGERVFISQGQDTRFSGKTEEELQGRGIFENEKWYAFPCGEESPAREVINAQPDLFIMEDGNAAIRTRDLYSLSPGEIRAVRGRDITYITRTVLFLFVILCAVFFFAFVQTWTTALIGQHVMKDLRLALFRKTASQSTDFLSRHPVGRIVTRLTGDVETINEFFTSVLVAFLKDLSVMVGVLITLFLLSPSLAAITLATMPPVLVVTLISRVKARDAFRRQRTASSRVNSYLSERLSGVQVVQLFLGEKKSASEFDVRNRELLDANLGEMYVFATFRPLVEWLSTVTTAVIITVGAAMVLKLSISLGVLIAFINLISMFYFPVMDIAEKYTLLQSAMAGGERVFKLLDTEEAIPDRGKRSILGAVRGHIEFKDVCFAYKKGENVLNGLSFTVNPGEMAAIVGYTGAGKTTITSVLARLWDIDGGSIKLDGIPIQDIPVEDLRRSVLPVLQDVFLFSGTIAENISLGLPMDESRIEEAAKTVHAHEFISRLPGGYRTMLSEGASNISSGQRQLISFARVIAHNPAIVVLDEATSSIDTETEHLIQLGMQQVLAGRTSVVIAHRLSTIRHADRILVLSGGRLVEEGRHGDLIAKNGLYATLYQLQYQKPGEETLP
ncbi:MAG: ABC transporter ATP-binding protein/permease [Spirochaetaceae bacterium]|jgi:ATP-binding cassette subfamily B protein|nr:ABC transporter ATP-binding protein/permease [Spirochaetaceae bacterium]